MQPKQMILVSLTAFIPHPDSERCHASHSRRWSRHQSDGSGEGSGLRHHHPSEGEGSGAVLERNVVFTEATHRLTTSWLELVF